MNFLVTFGLGDPDYPAVSNVKKNIAFGNEFVGTAEELAEGNIFIKKNNILLNCKRAKINLTFRRVIV